LTILLGAALTVELSGLFLTASITRDISKRIKAMLGMTDQISKGNYRVSLATRSTDEVGRLTGALNKMARDLDREQHRAERAVVLAEGALKEAKRVAHIGSWEWNVGADQFVASKEFLRLSEASPACFDPHYDGFIRMIRPHDRAAVDETIQAAMRSGASFTVDYRIATMGDVDRWICVQGTVERDGSGVPVRLVGTASDITDRKRSEERLAHLAQHDTLTGLPNRALLIDRLRQAIAFSQRNHVSGALFFMDLDHFKELNDTQGHAAGDRLLIAVAECLKGRIRDVDTVARSGGDEFLIVLSNLASPDAANAVARHVLGAFAQPFSVDGRELYVTASVGISIFPGDSLDVETLIRDADTAMYQAKKLGRNKYQFFSAQMHHHALLAQAMHDDLRNALARSEFVLHYQPIVDLESGSIVGAEALVRWKHPSGALRMPDEFIAVAEDNGLIVPLGDWVLAEAAAQCRRWRDAGLGDLRVSVNASVVQLHQPGFAATVAEALGAAGLNADALQIEIAETALLAEGDRAERGLSELRALGVRVQLDEFGIGYSSLNALKRFSIDAVKIDRTFVKDLVDDAYDRAIARSIVDLCHGVGLRITAEGVETRAQLELLRRLGYDEVQGYCFSGALGAERFEALVRCWRTPGEGELGHRPVRAAANA